MSYDERLKKVLGPGGEKDVYWKMLIEKFIKENYEDSNEAFDDLEQLLQDKDAFNEFTKKLSHNANDMSGLKDDLKKALNNSEQTTDEIVVTVGQRIYNGHYNKGSIFSSNYEYKGKNESASISFSISFCIDDSNKEKAMLSASIPFSVNPDNYSKLNELIKRIESNSEYLYNETHYAKDKFDPEKYNYVDVSINGNNYEIPKNDQILNELQSLINCQLPYQVVIKEYQSLIQ